MPVYSYRCAKNHHYDDIQHMPGQPQKRCPICGGMGERQIRAVGVIFKGDGFHCNDYGPYGRKEGK